MGAVVVGVDVGGDLLSCLVEGLELGAPDEPLLQLPEPRFDEGLRFGVAVAAAAVRDAELAELLAEATAGESAAVVGAERQRPCFDDAAATAAATSSIASSVRQRSSRLQPTISRVQQSIAAFRYVQPCSATQTEVMSKCQS